MRTAWPTTTSRTSDDGHRMVFLVLHFLGVSRDSQNTLVSADFREL